MGPDWFAAAMRGDTESLALCLERGGDVDAPGDYGYTALQFAAWGRHLEAVRWLLDRRADPNRDPGWGSAVTEAALWSRGWEVQAGRCVAVAEPDGRALDLMLRYGGRPGLREAILLEDAGLARRAIAGDPSIDVNGESGFGMHDTFLMLAAHVGSVAMVDLLLDEGAEIEGTDDIGGTALRIASEMGRVDVVRRLLDRGAEINRGWPGYSALAEAIDHGRAEVVALLLARGAEPEEPDGRGD